jgi:hypothetical protein
MSTEKSWTVMVYLAGDNNLDEFGVTDLREMKKVGSTDQVNVVAQFDREGEGVRTRRYYVRKGGTLDADVVEELGETNCGDPKVLADFVKWGIKNYPAAHCMLVLWNHGAGWDDTNVYRLAREGMGRAITRRGDFAARGADGDEVSVRRIRVVGGRKFRRALFSSTVRDAIRLRGIAYDDNAQDFLDNIEMKKVLTAASRSLGRKIDILGMDACLMSMVEVSYQVRTAVEFTVGSEEVEPGDGWPYTAILRDLTKKPAMAPRDLAAAIVKRYLASYDAESGVTLAASDLSKCAELREAIDGLATALTSALREAALRACIISARAGVQTYEKAEYVDLHDLCDMLDANCGTPEIRAACADVRQALIEDEFVVAAGFRGRKVEHSHGVSIYFPERGPVSPLYKTLDFARSGKWDTFLAKYVESLSRREAPKRAAPIR